METYFPHGARIQSSDQHLPMTDCFSNLRLFYPFLLEIHGTYITSSIFFSPCFGCGTVLMNFQVEAPLKRKMVASSNNFQASFLILFLYILDARVQGTCAMVFVVIAKKSFKLAPQNQMTIFKFLFFLSSSPGFQATLFGNFYSFVPYHIFWSQRPKKSSKNHT